MGWSGSGGLDAAEALASLLTANFQKVCCPLFSEDAKELHRQDRDLKQQTWLPQPGPGRQPCSRKGQLGLKHVRKRAGQP